MRQLFMQLVKDIQSNNLGAAQNDYASLTQLQDSNGGDGPFSLSQWQNRIDERAGELDRIVG